MKLWIVLTLAAVLAGCATIDTVERSDDRALYAAHAATIASISSWKIRGRLSARSQDRGDIARLLWNRDVKRHHFELYGTIGSRRIRIFQDDQSVSLEDTQGAMIEGTSARSVIRERTGWDLPIDELIYWLVGAVSEDSPAEIQWDTNGHLVSIVQAGWDVTLANYRSFGSYKLPTRLFIKRLPGRDDSENAQSSESQTFEIRIAIKEWGV